MSTLTDRVAIITGASQGIGRAIAEMFLQEGASIAICARSASMLAKSRESLEVLAGDSARVLCACVDVSDPHATEEFVRQTYDRFGALHILVNNAGIHGPKGRIDQVSLSDWNQAVQVNLLGSMYAMRAVIPYMRSAGYGKIIQLSGGGATKPMPFLGAYAATKTAVVRLAETVACELKGTGIDVNAIAPGAINTRLLDDVLLAGPDKVGEEAYRKALEQKSNGGSSALLAAQLAVFLASPKSDGVTGRLISAVWDNWEKIPELKEEISNSDIFTLRRIIGKDRGMSCIDV